MRAFLLLILCTTHAVPLASESVRLVTAIGPDNVASPAINHLIDTLFSRIKTPYSLEYRPARRAEFELIKGKFDGDIARTSLFAQSHPDLIRIDPPIITLKLYAFSHTLQIRQITDLHQRKVAYIRGAKMVETPYGRLATLHPTNSSQACINMAKAQRVDVCLISSGLISQQDIAQAQRELNTHIISQVDTHIWLASNQQQLSKKLSQGLLHMQQDGSLAKHQRSILNAQATPSASSP
ncbi:transporter substrate-binding domain-containing protein [Chitinibacter sp. GC72]|uniref:transporter substrate-binding domain-containing protein n=1 Tax=Chitinibacter sp. GC72 TaxID=1526917 RepID=UPI0012FA20EA|nr:transporter substrate-binding domain-containing protein [Chitinibacter sp. GC72]